MPSYTEFHPRWYRPRMSTYWWLERRRYLKFILRELSSVFVAWFVVITLLQIAALSRGEADWMDFQQFMSDPVVVAVNVVSLLFILFHTITWFNLAPKAMQVRMGGKRVPDVLVAGPNYVAWLAVSAAVAWLLLRK